MIRRALGVVQDVRGDERPHGGVDPLAGLVANAVAVNRLLVSGGTGGGQQYYDADYKVVDEDENK